MLAALFLLALTQTPATPPASTPAVAAPAAKGSVVVLETSLGRIKIGLDAAKAPTTVENFLSYVRAGHYDGTIFHRVIPGFMVQGGGFDADMKERSTRAPIKNESKNGRRNLRGTLAMARTNDPHSATAQFFINVKDNASLDFGVAPGWGYAVFGEVLEGMDVVDRIVSVPTTSKGPHQNVPAKPVVITSAKVAR
jgi:cyclophilin family peptidyl-prolyl cis-trans isomerase